MEEALRAFLLADSGVQAEVATRLNWGLRPDRESLSAITLTVVSGPRDYTYQGRSGFIPYRVQADCWGIGPGAAKRAARAVVEALDTLSSVAGFDTPLVENETDDTDKDATGAPVNRTRLDLYIPFNA